MKRKHSTIKLEATGKHTNTRKFLACRLLLPWQRILGQN